MSNPTDSNEWKTVTRGRYVPPSKRSEVEKRVAEEEKKKPLDFTSDKSFPTLGVTTKATEWGDKKSFTDTIHGLIALEQRTAEEREAAEEEAKKNEGNAILRLPKTREEWMALAERFSQRAKQEAEYCAALEMGCPIGQVDQSEFQPRNLYEMDSYAEVIYQDNSDEEDDYIISRQKATPYFAYGSPAGKSKESGSAKKRIALLERKRQSLLARKAAQTA